MTEIVLGLPRIFAQIQKNVLSFCIAPGECNYIFSRPLRESLYGHTYRLQLTRFLYVCSVCVEVGIDVPNEYIQAIRARAKRGK